MLRRFKTVFGGVYLLSDERWSHITEKHPEIKRYANKIKEVLFSPDLIKVSKKDRTVYLLYKFYREIFDGKYLLIVVHVLKKEIITAFITDKIKEGDIIWQKR